MFKSKEKQKQPHAMDQETFSLILHGCKLAKDLESNLGNLANQPEILSKSCDDIIKIFATAKQRLSNASDPALFTHHLLRQLPQDSSQQQQQTDPSLQEWLKYGVLTQPIDMIQQQPASGKTPFELDQGFAASGRMKGSISIGREIQATMGGVSVSGKGSSSSSQRPQRSSSSSSSRKDDDDKCRMRVAAPQMGNTDVPPEDNYTWRKYGQKEILGSTYPRAYYRCTHQKMYNCPAKKQVQRLDNDFNTFEVTYIGQHTCHMSSTAPSIPPPPPPTQAMVAQPTPTSSSSVPLGTWLSMEFGLGSGSGSGSSSGPVGRGSGSAAAGAGAGAGGSNTGSRYGRDVVEYPAVADMADVMFNSGSSSSNSMDFIFPCVEDKWEAGGGSGSGSGDKKN